MSQMTDTSTGARSLQVCVYSNAGTLASGDDTMGSVVDVSGTLLFQIGSMPKIFPTECLTSRVNLQLNVM